MFVYFLRLRSPLRLASTISWRGSLRARLAERCARYAGISTACGRQRDFYNDAAQTFNVGDVLANEIAQTFCAGLM